MKLCSAAQCQCWLERSQCGTAIIETETVAGLLPGSDPGEYHKIHNPQLALQQQ